MPGGGAACRAAGRHAGWHVGGGAACRWRGGMPVAGRHTGWRGSMPVAGQHAEWRAGRRGGMPGGGAACQVADWPDLTGQQHAWPSPFLPRPVPLPSGRLTAVRGVACNCAATYNIHPARANEPTRSWDGGYTNTYRVVSTQNLQVGRPPPAIWSPVPTGCARLPPARPRAHNCWLAGIVAPLPDSPIHNAGPSASSRPAPTDCGAGGGRESRGRESRGREDEGGEDEGGENGGQKEPSPKIPLTLAIFSVFCHATPRHAFFFVRAPSGDAPAPGGWGKGLSGLRGGRGKASLTRSHLCRPAPSIELTLAHAPARSRGHMQALASAPACAPAV